MSIGNAILRRRGTGWVQNLPDSRDHDFDRLGVTSSDLPDSVSLRPYLRQIRNQRSANSCVGEAIATAISIAECKAGLPHVPVSSLYPYWYARYQHGSTRIDKGTYPRYALNAMRRIGIPDERYWPFRLDKVNRQPVPKANMEAHPRRDGSYVSIKDTGTGRILAARAALTAEKPFIFGTQITRAFQGDIGSSVFDRPYPHEKLAGGHMLTAIGYKHDGLYGLLFEVANSYDDDWRDDGCCWITEDYLRWVLTKNLTIVYGWKRLQEAA